MTGMRRFDTEMLSAVVQSLWLWAGLDPRRIASIGRRAFLLWRAARRRARNLKTRDLVVPPVIIQSATMRCNLTCKGCYSRNYSLDDELTTERMDSLFTEAEKLGVSLFVITGGEPFLRDGLLDLLLRHRDLIFLLFNNGTFLDSQVIARIGRSDNIVPLLSVEGDEEMTDRRRGKGTYRRVIDTMRQLQAARSMFGFSTMVSAENIELLYDARFYDGMISLGCRIGLLVGYVPSGPGADLDLLPRPEQQWELRARFRQLQKNRTCILMQMPEDEYERTGACMAAGRGFVHVNARGYVEPCPFYHVSTHSVAGHSLAEALGSPWLRHIREKTTFTETPHLGCALVEHRDELSAAMEALGASSTERPGSDHAI